MNQNNNAVTEVTKILTAAIDEEFEEIIVIGVTKGNMRVMALNMDRIHMLGLMEIAKHDLLSKGHFDA